MKCLLFALAVLLTAGAYARTEVRIGDSIKEGREFRASSTYTNNCNNFSDLAKKGAAKTAIDKAISQCVEAGFTICYQGQVSVLEDSKGYLFTDSCTNPYPASTAPTMKKAVISYEAIVYGLKF